MHRRARGTVSGPDGKCVVAGTAKDRGCGAGAKHVVIAGYATVEIQFRDASHEMNVPMPVRVALLSVTV